MLHLASLATLARGALEAASAAVWMLSPKSRDERITRALRWNFQDFRDSNTAFTEVGIQGLKPLTDRLRRIEEVAARRCLTVTSGYSSTVAVRAAHQFTQSKLGALLPWRLCSGFAHGRRWALLNFSDTEVVSSPSPHVALLRVTNTEARSLYLAMAAAALVRDAVDLYERARKRHT